MTIHLVDSSLDLYGKTSNSSKRPLDHARLQNHSALKDQVRLQAPEIGIRPAGQSDE